MHLPWNATEGSDDDRRPLALPESQRLSGSGRFQGMKQRSVARDVVVGITGASVDQHEGSLGSVALATRDMTRQRNIQ